MPNKFSNSSILNTKIYSDNSAFLDLEVKSYNRNLINDSLTFYFFNQQKNYFRI